MLHMMATLTNSTTTSDVTDPIAQAFSSVITALFALATPFFSAIGFIVVLVFCLKTMFAKKSR